MRDSPPAAIKNQEPHSLMAVPDFLWLIFIVQIFDFLNVLI